MVSSPACPNEAELLAVVVGEEPSNELREHLAACPKCPGRLERLRAELAALRERPAEAPLSPSTGSELEADPATANGHGGDQNATAPWPAAESSETHDSEPETDLRLTCQPGGGREANLPATIGKYLVIGRFPPTGQADVFRVVHPGLAKDLVLKLSLEPVRPDGRCEIIEEGKILASLDHPHLVRVYDQDFHDDRPYLVMEYIRGRTLDQVASEGRLTPRQAAALLAKVARAADHAHRKGVVHRDIKPRNILVDELGEPRLIDFGMAHLRHAWSDDPARPGGTFAFMAPEQARFESPEEQQKVGPRSDVFALGGVLSYLLTGQVPFPGQNWRESMDRARRYDFDRKTLDLPAIPRGLRRICLKALAPDPAERYASAAELGHALDRFAQPRRRLGPVLSVAILILVGVVAWSLGLFRRPASWRVNPPRVAAGDASRSEPEPGEEPMPVSTRGTLTDAYPVPPAPRAAGSGPVDPLSGDLSVRVWSPRGHGPKHGWRVEDSESLPVMNGEEVQLQVRLNRAAYVYLLWVTSEGTVLPLYPWKVPKLGFASPLPDPTPAAVVHCPAQLNGGWTVKGVSGLETALLLARDTPLPRDIALDREIGRLPAARRFNLREVVWLEYAQGRPVVRRLDPDHRDLDLDQPQRIDDPILNMMERLRPHFGLLKAVRFAHQGN
jgi:serine/threonine protein kinase